MTQLLRELVLTCEVFVHRRRLIHMKFYTMNSHVISFEVSCAISYQIIDYISWAKFHMKFLMTFIYNFYQIPCEILHEISYKRNSLWKLYRKYHGSFGFRSECGIKKGLTTISQVNGILHFEDDPFQLFVMALTGFHVFFHTENVSSQVGLNSLRPSEAYMPQ